MHWNLFLIITRPKACVKELLKGSHIHSAMFLGRYRNPQMCKKGVECDTYRAVDTVGGRGGKGEVRGALVPPPFFGPKFFL